MSYCDKCKDFHNFQYCPANDGDDCVDMLSDIIKSQQQETEQNITWNEAHTKARAEQAQQIAQKNKALEQARETILSVFREQPSQESIEFAEYVLRDIDKALGGANSELLE